MVSFGEKESKASLALGCDNMMLMMLKEAVNSVRTQGLT